MNAITVSKTAAKTVEAPEVAAIDIEDTAPGITYLLPETKDIPLSRLVPSPANVRRVNAAVNVEELADSIEAHGLIQNLTVRKAKRGNKYEVVAGARRFAALSRLVSQGRLDKATLITCNIRSGADNDTEISLAENTQREAMLGSLSQLSCWVRTAVMVVGDIRGAYRGRHTDVRVKRSRSVARTTLDAAATPQAC